MSGGQSGTGLSRPKLRHVYKTGASGCGGKAASTTAKNSGQPLPCPFCDRIFKQDGRLKDHLKNQHGDQNLDEHGPPKPPDSATGIEALAAAKNQSSSYYIKTPKTLLQEWCQKNKRPTAKYKQVVVEGGFQCRIILPDEKKSEADVILWYKDAPETTSQAAQQRAAVVALYHVMGDRRLDRILPEEYREQWRELDCAAEKKMAFLKDHPPKLKSRAKLPAEELHSVYMSEGNRRLVEDLIRDASPTRENIESSTDDNINTDATFSWRYKDKDNSISSEKIQLNRQDISSSNWVSQMSDCRASGSPESNHCGPQSNSMHIQLVSMGFSEKYVTTATSKFRDLCNALDWLVLNIPEGELPARFAPDASKSSVQVLVRERYAIESTTLGLSLHSLQQYGYSTDDCNRALVKSDGVEMLALSQLFHSLVYDGDVPAGKGTSLRNCDELSEIRSEEKLALQSIFGDDAVHLSDSCMTFQLGGAANLEIEAFFPRENCYPYEIPIIGFHGINVPAEKLLNITKKVANYSLQLVGAPMIYDLVAFAREIAHTSLPGYSNTSERLVEKVHPDPNGSSYAFMEHKISGGSHVSEEITYLKDRNPGPHPRYEVPVPERFPANVRMENAQTTHHHSNVQRKGRPLLPGIESTRLKADWEQFMNLPKHADLRMTRSKLPAFTRRSDVLVSVQKHQVTIICGETGCGKSTQVPQYILEDNIERNQGGMCNIICTQPRRLSAISLADRVARERSEATGEIVGYSVRLESSQSSRTRLLFCTTGILLRRLLSDPELQGVTHVVVDEVHERSLETDLLLLVLRELLKRNYGSLRIVLMSATVDASLYINYFQAAIGYPPAMVQIPGFTYPVRELFLEDALELTGYRVGRSSRYALKHKKVSVVANQRSGDMDTWESRMADQNEDLHAPPGRYSDGTEQSLRIVDEAIINFELIEALLICIMQQEDSLTADASCGVVEKKAGAVLVFLPGIFEIRKLQARLQSSSKFTSWGFKLKVLALHGSLSAEEQRRVFLRPPHGVWKVVLATNIAETSITIDDIVYVIDTGRQKEMSYDHIRGLSSLEESWVTKANAKQRRGRAGRVQAGCCIRLFSRKQFQRLDELQLPEMLRVSLEGLCLKVKSLLSGSIGERLINMITPPLPEAIAVALRSLQGLNALDSAGDLTPLGQHLAKMPVDVRIGKMLLFGCILRCLDPILTIAACLSGRSPFLAPMEQREEASAARQELAASSKSDHLAVVAAFDGWLNAREEGFSVEMDYCKAHYLSRETLLGIEASRMDYERVLLDMGFITSNKGRTSAADDDSASCFHINARSSRVVKAVICAGFYPNVVRVHHPERKYVQTEGGSVVKAAAAQELRYHTKQDGRVFIHPSSVVFPVGHYESPWLVYSERVKTSKVFVRECSMVPAYGLLLFGGDISVNHKEQAVAVDGWLQFEAPARIGLLIRELRSKLDSLLLQKLQNPCLDVGTTAEVAVVTQLLTTDGF